MYQMRASVSSPEQKIVGGSTPRSRVVYPPRFRRTITPVGEEGLAEGEPRKRLVWWIRYGMFRIGMNQASLADAIGVPDSTLSRWLDPDEKAIPPLTVLGRLCRALHLDPMVFAKLDPIPADPLGPYDLPVDSDLLVVTDAARLAQLDMEPVEEADPPAAFSPPGRLRTRRSQGARQCPRE